MSYAFLKWVLVRLMRRAEALPVAEMLAWSRGERLEEGAR
jgi:hypothetical protein